MMSTGETFIPASASSTVRVLTILPTPNPFTTVFNTSMANCCSTTSIISMEVMMGEVRGGDMAV